MRRRYLLIVILCFMAFNVGFLLIAEEYAPLEVVTDADRLPSGNTLICNAPLNKHKVIEVDPAGNIVWGFFDVKRVHDADILPNGNILIADTENDRVIEVNYTTQGIEWEWRASDTNWTEINSSWDENHYYNNPTGDDWTHLNDVDYFPVTDTLLISLRNFDLIIELNKSSNQIIWTYGDLGAHSLLNHQHNPDKMPNGNIIVSDSENNRIIIINYTTKQIEWVYDEGLSWPRDCDFLNATGTILITDTMNNRILEVNMGKEVVWSYKGQLMLPYEADLLENGNILIGNGIGNNVLEVSRNGIIVWSFGVPFYSIFYIINIIFVASLVLQRIVETTKAEGHFRNRKNYRLLFLLGLCIWMGLLYSSILSAFFDLIWNRNIIRFLEVIFG